MSPASKRMIYVQKIFFNTCILRKQKKQERIMQARANMRDLTVIFMQYK